MSNGKPIATPPQRPPASPIRPPSRPSSPPRQPGIAPQQSNTGKTLSIVAFVLSLLFFVPFAPLAGLIIGIIALTRAKRDPTVKKGLAIAAVVISSILIGLSIIWIGMFAPMYIYLY